MKTYKTLLLLLFCAIVTGKVHSQDTIYLSNPSFEDTPRHSHTPKDWVNCGFQGESPPDVQPNLIFQVTKQALKGISYLGMVARDNDTWESVGGNLNTALLKNHCYQFQIALARSESYISMSRKNPGETTNYNTPAKLRIWGGTSLCNRAELLAKSELIQDLDWHKYSFHIRPTLDDVQFIILEVFYNALAVNSYNSNLLTDDASPFILSSVCDTTHLHGQPPTQGALGKNLPLNIPIQFEYPRNLPAESIDKDRICHFIGLLNDMNDTNIEDGLWGLIDYSRNFSTERWNWTITVSGENQKKHARTLNRKIKSLGLLPFVKAVAFNKLHTDVVLLCERENNSGKIGVYY